MPQQPKLPRALPPEPDDRIRRLINLTARLVDKMLAQEPQDPTQPRSVPDEQ
jgi:hypothetical protein